MKSIPILLFTVLLSVKNVSAQQAPERIVYFVDSVLVKEDPEPGNEITEENIAEVTIIKNKDTLKLLGFGDFDAVAYIFTKAYSSRPGEIKKIPTTGRMEMIGKVWHYKGAPYSGPFIDYYYSGHKEGEGVLKNGKLEGLRKKYYPNGNVLLERNYTAAVPDGEGKEFYENGALKQKGIFKNGIEDGIWEMYFPNGQVRQRSNFIGGKMEGEVTIYYSTGKVLAVENFKNGKASPDKSKEKLYRFLEKGHELSRERDFAGAIKQYTKAIETDSNYAEAYFARGTARLSNFEFDGALADLDKALACEPYLARALSNRAFARLRKYQFGGSRKLKEMEGVTIMAGKEKPIPENEMALICADLKQAVFLGDKHQMNLEAIEEHCTGK